MSGDIPLSQLQPNMNGLNTTVIVLDPGQYRRTQNGSIITMRVADATGSISASIMNPEFTETFKGGDILKFRSAYTSIFQGGLTLNVGKNGDCKKAGEFMMVFSDTPDITSLPLPAGTVDRRADDGRMQRGPPGNRYQRNQ
ncbi:unnamed protein product [Caenorhabditis sp. 36 PRJEB53466]|nr:unnamed protein product [Caenorhabditis sp. 36 PRJEB53466]